MLITEGPRLCAFWGLEKTVLHEICVSGTVWGPLLTRKSPTCMYISQKLRGSGNCVCDFCVSGGLSVFSTLTTRTDSFFDHKLHFQDSIVIQSMQSMVLDLLLE